MGRHKKYYTEEDKLKARKARQAKYYQSKKNRAMPTGVKLDDSNAGNESGSLNQPLEVVPDGYFDKKEIPESFMNGLKDILAGRVLPYGAKELNVASLDAYRDAIAEQLKMTPENYKKEILGEWVNPDENAVFKQEDINKLKQWGSASIMSDDERKTMTIVPYTRATGSASICTTASFSIGTGLYLSPYTVVTTSSSLDDLPKFVTTSSLWRNVDNNTKINPDFYSKITIDSNGTMIATSSSISGSTAFVDMLVKPVVTAENITFKFNENGSVGALDDDLDAKLLASASLAMLGEEKKSAQGLVDISSEASGSVVSGSVVSNVDNDAWLNSKI